MTDLNWKEEEEIFDFFAKSDASKREFSDYYERIDDRINCWIADYLNDNYDINAECYDKDLIQSKLSDEEWKELVERGEVYKEGRFKGTQHCEKFGIDPECGYRMPLQHPEDKSIEWRRYLNDTHLEYYEQELEERGLFTPKMLQKIKNDDVSDELVENVIDHSYQLLLDDFSKKIAEDYVREASDGQFITIRKKN